MLRTRSLAALVFVACACGTSATTVDREDLDGTESELEASVGTLDETRVTQPILPETKSPVGSKDDVSDFEVIVDAPSATHGYSEITVGVASERDIASIQVLSEDLTVVSSTSTEVIVLTPIVQQNQTIEYWVEATTSEGDSIKIAKQLDVVLYEHDVERFRHLNSVDLEGTFTPDYAVFNFGFETLFINERYSETYCYPTVNDCNDLGGSFTADAHNWMAGDFNGDGHQDLVVGWAISPHTLNHESPSTVRVYLNNGAGRLVADPTIYASGVPPERHLAYRLVVEDFNLDGIDDVFAGSTGMNKLLPTGEWVTIREPHVLLLSRNGRLVDASDAIEYGDTMLFAHDASAGDINGDGFPDILAARTLFLNQGGLGFVSSIEKLPEVWRSDWSGYVMSSLLEDFNGDGLADPVLFWNDQPNSPYPWPPQIAISQRGIPIANWQVHNLLDGYFGAGSTKFNHAAAADLDGDGDKDIVVATTRSTPYYVGRFLQVFINDGSGSFVDRSQEAMGDQPRAANYKDPDVQVECTVHGEGQVVLLDLDDDGDIDIADQTSGGKDGSEDACPGIAIYLNDGVGGFEKDEITQLARVGQHQIPGFVAWPNAHQIGNAIPIDLDGRFGIDYVAQIRSPWGGLFSFLYQVMSLR